MRKEKNDQPNALIKAVPRRGNRCVMRVRRRPAEERLESTAFDEERDALSDLCERSKIENKGNQFPLPSTRAPYLWYISLAIDARGWGEP